MRALWLLLLLLLAGCPGGSSVPQASYDARTRTLAVTEPGKPPLYRARVLLPGGGTQVALAPSPNPFGSQLSWVDATGANHVATLSLTGPSLSIDVPGGFGGGSTWLNDPSHPPPDTLLLLPDGVALLVNGASYAQAPAQTVQHARWTAPLSGGRSLTVDAFSVPGYLNSDVTRVLVDGAPVTTTHSSYQASGDGIEIELKGGPLQLSISIDPQQAGTVSENGGDPIPLSYTPPAPPPPQVQ